VRAGLAHLVLPERARKPAQALAWFEGLLLRERSAAKIHATSP
jgi:hypothetical protein